MIFWFDPAENNKTNLKYTSSQHDNCMITDERIILMNKMLILVITCYVLMMSRVCCLRSIVAVTGVAAILANLLILLVLILILKLNLLEIGKNIKTCRFSKQINFISGFLKWCMQFADWADHSHTGDQSVFHYVIEPLNSCSRVSRNA